MWLIIASANGYFSGVSGKKDEGSIFFSPANTFLSAVDLTDVLVLLLIPGEEEGVIPQRQSLFRSSK